jgi:hypothetical protein
MHESYAFQNLSHEKMFSTAELKRRIALGQKIYRAEAIESEEKTPKKPAKSIAVGARSLATLRRIPAKQPSAIKTESTPIAARKTAKTAVAATKAMIKSAEPKTAANFK